MGGMSDMAERIRALIVDSDASQAEFAEAVGLDASKLSKSLSGARRFSSLDLARIAEHANVTVDWLLTGNEARLATAARAHVGSSAETAVSLARRLAELRESAARLGYPQRWTELAIGLPHGRAYEQGAALAQHVLKRIARGVGEADVIDLPEVIEQVFGIDVCITDLGDAFDGLAVATDDARIILAAATPTAYRQRFTVAHELAHLLVGDDQGVHVDEDIYGPAAKKDVSEIRANAFAAALLMPREVLEAAVGPGFDEATFAALSSRLQVTPSALAYRLLGIRLIDEMTARRWGAMTAGRAAQETDDVDRLSEATRRSTTARPPGLLAKDLMQAYLDGRTTLRLYAGLLGVETEALRRTLEEADSGEL